MAAPASESFADRLRRYRERAGFTQEALAERAGLTANAISSLERGERRRPYPHTVRSLADALDLGNAERTELFALAAGRLQPAGTAREAKPALPEVSLPEQNLRPVPLFPRTKLQRPRSRANLLRRDRLINQIGEQIESAKLILVSAPVGAGKTTLLATTVAALDIPTAWVTLDPEDNDLSRFLALLVAALKQLAPEVEQETAQHSSALQSAAVLTPQHAQPIIDAALNAMLDTGLEASLLILDDLHVITTPAVYTVLDYLLAHLPAQLSLAVATRSDPPLALPRLRVRGELLELRLPDLRFTLGEAGALLNDRLALGLDPSDLAALHQHTDGWAAPIGLLASSLEQISGDAERRSWLHRLGELDSNMFDYLADEVLSRQDPFVRTFLLETSILVDLVPAACAHITGRSDAAQVLTDLYKRNLFLIRLYDQPSLRGPAAEGAVYRYHDMFREFLRSRLRNEAPDWWRMLHRRAARTDDQPQRCFHYLAQAEDWPEATRYVEQHGEALISQGRADLVEGWLQALPQSYHHTPALAALHDLIAQARCPYADE